MVIELRPAKSQTNNFITFDMHFSTILSKITVSFSLSTSFILLTASFNLQKKVRFKVEKYWNRDIVTRISQLLSVNLHQPDKSIQFEFRCLHFEVLWNRCTVKYMYHITCTWSTKSSLVNFSKLKKILLWK